MQKKHTSVRMSIALFLLAGLLSLTILSISFAHPVQAGLLSTPTPGRLFVLPDVRTPLPPEMLANRFQTNGVIAGGVVLVLIIVVGAANVIRHK